MTIDIINKSNNALPKYESELAAGMDLRAFITDDIVLGTLERIMIPTGLYIKLPEGYEAQIRPRSGLSIKYGITIINTPGTIDADYIGEICILLVNLSKDDFRIQSGDRIAQMVINKFEVCDEFNEVEVLEKTERGEGGFSSTGLK